jgi:hypothetical protein
MEYFERHSKTYPVTFHSTRVTANLPGLVSEETPQNDRLAGARQKHPLDSLPTPHLHEGLAQEG